MSKAAAMFLLGDVVRKIGETQKMTVDVVKPGRVQTCWFDDEANYTRGEFDAKDLELVPADELEDDEEDESFEDDDEDWDDEDDFADSFEDLEDEDEEDDEGEDESGPDFEDEDDLETAETPAAGIATEPVVEA